jgi:hypothetical protein
MLEKNSHAGHRARLREEFLAAPGAFSDKQLLELLLTYAISRQDVAPLADRLLEVFGSLEGIFAASTQELMPVMGIGEATAVLIQAVGQIPRRLASEADSEPCQEEDPAPMEQPRLFSMDLPQEQPEPEKPARQAPKPPPPPPTKADVRAYTNDLIKVALTHLPAVVSCDTFADFSNYLEQNLPYNSAITRNRYSRYLTNRYYPQGDVSTPLTTLLTYEPDEASWKAALFYETARVEPAVQFTAEQVVWPALPAGYVLRETLKESLVRRFAEASEGTISRMIYSLVNLYTTLDVAGQENGRLRLQTRPGTLAAFLYVLASEFPEAGIYPFAALDQGPARRWLLWDREWMRRQLYNLRDLAIVAKISEIDGMRQFTLLLDQVTAIETYFEHPQRDELILRESPAAVEGVS